jgi:penicillin-binding protein 1A
MTTALRDRPVRDFKVPEGVVFAKVNTQTGQTASEDSPETRFEVFKEGSVPAPDKGESDDQLLKEVF